MRSKRVKYHEGQWFAVPLRTGGYAPGIIVRGGSAFKGGLGYFFPIHYTQPPSTSDVEHLSAKQAILIGWFGDLGIIEGRWPLIFSDRPFSRNDWPMPRFGRVDAINPEWGWITEYSQDDDGSRVPIAETRCPVTAVTGLPEVGTASAGYVEVKLVHPDRNSPPVQAVNGRPA